MPTLPQKIEAIRAVCVKNDKSILDLKFGCKIKLHPSVKDEIIYSVIGKQGNFWMIGSECKDQDAFQEAGNHWHVNSIGENSGFEIIGRDILLSDVLAAINPLKMFSVGLPNASIRTLLMEWVTHGETKLAEWNLLHPSLDDQEEATINLVYEILK